MPIVNLDVHEMSSGNAIAQTIARANALAIAEALAIPEADAIAEASRSQRQLR